MYTTDILDKYIFTLKIACSVSWEKMRLPIFIIIQYWYKFEVECILLINAPTIDWVV